MHESGNDNILMSLANDIALPLLSCAVLRDKEENGESEDKYDEDGDEEDDVIPDEYDEGEDGEGEDGDEGADEEEDDDEEA